MKFRGLFTSITSFVIIALWSISVHAAPPNWPPPGLAIAEVAQTKYGDELLETEGVVGHGITIDKSGRAAIVVFTERPLVPGIPGILDQVPVDVRFTGRFYALAPPRSAVVPLRNAHRSASGIRIPALILRRDLIGQYQ